VSSSAYARVRGFWLLCALAATVGYALAQKTGIIEPSKPGDLEKVPRVPGMSSLTRGVNGGITYAGVHNSTIGWYDVIVPAVSYSFSERYSVDASATIYLHRLVQDMDLTALPSQRLVLDVGDSGDTVIGLHGSFHPKMFDDLATVSLTVPTGNRTNGLGTGRVTFDFNNRMERFFGRKGVHLDLGIGDSAAVANSLLMRDYNTLGALAHFETGAAIWLKRYGFVQASAYEQFPIGDQKVYQLVPFGSDTSGSDSSQATEVLISRGLSEDNGLTASFGIPVTSHLLFSGYYNRSLRQHQDTVSFGMTFVVRSLPGRRRLSMIDRALREAAGLSPDSQ
jgi:hypothetical protein